MSIRFKLLVSYFAMILVPIVIFSLFAALLAAVFFKDIKALGDVNNENIGKEWFQSVIESFDKKNELLAGIRFIAQYDPDLLADDTFLTKTDEQLKPLQTGLIVVTNDRITFASSLADRDDLYARLKQLDTSRWGDNGNDRYSVERIDFTLGNRTSGTVYVLTDVTQFIGFITKFFPAVIVSLLLAIGLTNGLLTYLVSRSIIRPLFALKQAAEHIQEGDLDHRLKVRKNDEIGQLGAAFEEMRRRLKQSLQIQLQYEENRKELISSISHDLKTPITGIKACIEGIFDGIADTAEKRDKYLKMIYKKATEMDYLIDELFLFSKLDLKRLPFHFVSIDLSAYLRDFVEELRLVPQNQGIRIDFRSDEDRPVYVMADKEKLRRVLINLVDNSFKYTVRDPKVIRIELLDREEEEVTVNVQDNGIGIDEKVLPYIFDRFYRVEPSRNTLTGGSGLGLAIVKQIVEEHGGTIRAKSIVGEGTTVSFTLRKKFGAEGGRS
ncbi:sensor histidine kinase [Paenibacillus thermotolerans]|uniref:sensor histidine kinase n=1 Tax=Paenibacillus thermotolerans TaxID=3027807 RepID=UPI00236855BB|nr:MULTISPECIES: HAMP domain-containing sensor histidine kinase [unclassified Paenibacillus]